MRGFSTPFLRDCSRLDITGLEYYSLFSFVTKLPLSIIVLALLRSHLDCRMMQASTLQIGDMNDRRGRRFY